jgi:hypothetical protein
MEEQRFPLLNTREFVAKWRTVVEEHLVSELTELVRPLAAGGGGTDLGPEQSAALARHVAYALQVAGSSNGGLHAAVEYLRQAAATENEDRRAAESRAAGSALQNE